MNGLDANATATATAMVMLFVGAAHNLICDSLRN